MSEEFEQTFLQRGYKKKWQTSTQKVFDIISYQANANQNHNRIHFTLIRIAIINKKRCAITILVRMYTN